MRALVFCALLVALTIPPAAAQTAPAPAAATPVDARTEESAVIPADEPAAPPDSETELAQAQPSGTPLGVSGDQQTSIRSAVSAAAASPVAAASLDFDVSVGTQVGAGVALSPLPGEIADIVPEYQGHQFFVLDDGRIVIVNPSNGQIVLIVQ